MPNIKSAQKRMELSLAAQAKNRAVRSRIRTAVKRVRDAESADAAESRMREAISLLDRAGRRNLFHGNKVARAKSQLQKFVDSLKA
jgi:small subunit ribosomal protein S20